jgi:GxxExxY protein
MHPLFAQASGINHDVVGAAMEVHKDKGPGLLESIYQWRLTLELGLRSRRVQKHDNVVIRNKQFCREEPLRFDLLVDGCLFVKLRPLCKSSRFTKRNCSAIGNCSKG